MRQFALFSQLLFLIIIRIVRLHFRPTNKSNFDIEFISPARLASICGTLNRPKRISFTAEGDATANSQHQMYSVDSEWTRSHVDQIPWVNRRASCGNTPKLCKNNCRRIVPWRTFPEPKKHSRRAHCEQLKLNWMSLVSTRCCGKRCSCAFPAPDDVRFLHPIEFPKRLANVKLRAIETGKWVAQCSPACSARTERGAHSYSGNISLHFCSHKAREKQQTIENMYLLKRDAVTGKWYCIARSAATYLIVSYVIAEQVLGGAHVSVRCVSVCRLWRAVDMHSAWMGLERGWRFNESWRTRVAIRPGSDGGGGSRADAVLRFLLCYLNESFVHCRHYPIIWATQANCRNIYGT